MVKVVPYQPAKKPRVGGLGKDQIWESPDGWGTDEELIRLFNDSPLPSTEETAAKPRRQSDDGK